MWGMIESKVRNFKAGLQILSILFLILAILSKLDGMDELALFLLTISGLISGGLLIVEYAFGQFKKWISSEGPQLDELIRESIRKHEEEMSSN